MKLLVCLLAALSANLALAQKKDYGTDFRGVLDARNATASRPFKTGTLAARPATCGASDAYFATDGPPQRRLSLCDSTNTWVEVGYSHGTSDPATCGTGQIFVRTDIPAIKVCIAPNTLASIAGGGAGGLCTPTNASGALQIPSTCIVFLSDGTPNTLGTNGTIGTFSGSGDVWVYLNSSGQFIAAHNLTGATCSILNCLSGQSGFPDRSRPIAKVSVVSGALQPATIVDYERTPQAPGGGSGGGVADPGGNGIMARTALNTTINRTITGTANRIVITNGDGTGGNPTADIGTDVATLTGTQTMTGKTVDTEATGNNYQVPDRREWLMAQCDGATGKLGPGWSSSATLAPTPTCTAGSTNTDLNIATLRFPDSDGAYHVQRTWYVPNDWTSNIGVDMRVVWSPVSSGAGNVVFTFRVICRGDTEARDVAFAFTGNLPVSSSTGTANQLRTASAAGVGISSWGASKVCSVDFSRDRANASDTLSGEVDVHLIEWTFRRIL